MLDLGLLSLSLLSLMHVRMLVPPLSGVIVDNRNTARGAGGTEGTVRSGQPSKTRDLAAVVPDQIMSR